MSETTALSLDSLQGENALALEILQKPKLERLYKSAQKSVKYVFNNGHVANFINHQYTTSDEAKIAELDLQVNLGHPDIRIDPNEKEIDPRMQDPKLRMRAQILSEILQAQAVATNPNRDMGNSVQGPMNHSNTQTIAPVAAGGNAQQLSAQLDSLMNPK